MNKRILLSDNVIIYQNDLKDNKSHEDVFSPIEKLLSRYDLLYNENIKMVYSLTKEGNVKLIAQEGNIDKITSRNHPNLEGKLELIDLDKGIIMLTVDGTDFYIETKGKIAPQIL